MTFTAPGPWAPDLPVIGHPGLIVAKNTYSSAPGKFAPWQTYEATGGSLDDTCLGAHAVMIEEGSGELFAGDGTKLYLQSGGQTFSNISKAGNYTVGTDERWRFTRYGQLIAATCYSEPIQQYTIGTSTLFADLSATAPKARHLATVRDFLVTGDTDESGAAHPNRVRWSPIGNPQGDWTDVTTQADFQDLRNGGQVMAIAGSEYGVVLCRDVTYRMTFTGEPNIVFSFDEVLTNIGCQSSGTMAQWGRFVFFLSEDGFQAFDGSQSYPIGDDKVDQWFLDRANLDAFSSISAAIDPEKRLYMVSYPKSGTTPQELLVYNWGTREWSYIEFDHELVLQAVSVPVTTDDFTTEVTDDITATTDDRAYTGGRGYFGAFNTSHQLGGFSGSAMTAIFESGLASQLPRRSIVRGFTPALDGDTTIRFSQRTLAKDATTYTTSATPSTRTGRATRRVDDVYVGYEITTSGEWTEYSGGDFEIRPGSLL